MDGLDFLKNKALFMFRYYVLWAATLCLVLSLNQRDVLGRVWAVESDVAWIPALSPLLALWPWTTSVTFQFSYNNKEIILPWKGVVRIKLNNKDKVPSVWAGCCVDCPQKAAIIMHLETLTSWHFAFFFSSSICRAWVFHLFCFFLFFMQIDWHGKKWYFLQRNAEVP